MPDQSNKWRDIASDPPPDGVVVETKIDNDGGDSMVQPLKRVTREPGKTRPLWFIPDGSIYVYYTPTHWRPLPGGVR